MSRVHPHRYAPDADLPPDYHGRRPCSTCGLTGTQGDTHHPDPLPTPPTRLLSPDLADAARDRDHAILGEKEDER